MHNECNVLNLNETRNALLQSTISDELPERVSQDRECHLQAILGMIAKFFTMV